MAVRGLGVPYGLALSPTVKAMSLNIKNNKSGPYNENTCSSKIIEISYYVYLKTFNRSSQNMDNVYKTLSQPK